MSDLLVPARDLKILDFDIETRLVGFYEAGRFKPKGSEPTAIAASWVGSDETFVWLQPETPVEEMLVSFGELYDEADFVTGHYIRKFDLPILNGAAFEHGHWTFSEKLVQDTKTDLITLEGLSKSQENLAEMLEIEESKFHMNDTKWRGATRLTESGIALARKRATGDVRQHKALRKALLNAGVLNPPTLWKP